MATSTKTNVLADLAAREQKLELARAESETELDLGDVQALFDWLKLISRSALEDPADVAHADRDVRAHRQPSRQG
jgi:hypothetical protein